MKRLITTFIIGLAFVVSANAQCSLENTAFNAGESLKYQLYFNWQFVWLKAGTASLDIQNANYQGKKCLRASLITKGSSRTDKFFMMRDTLTSYFTNDLLPLYYRKGAREGKRYYTDEAWYTQRGNQVDLRQRYTKHDGSVRTNEQSSTECIFDMVSMMMRARSFDPSAYKEGQRLHFLMADGGRVKNETLIYRGRKNFKMDGTNTTYRCLVFSFIEQKEKKEKEVVTFYITDDKNHIPVRLDLYLRFGTAKAFLISHTEPRNPMTSVVK